MNSSPSKPSCVVTRAMPGRRHLDCNGALCDKLAARRRYSAKRSFFTLLATLCDDQSW